MKLIEQIICLNTLIHLVLVTICFILAATYEEGSVKFILLRMWAICSLIYILPVSIAFGMSDKEKNIEKYLPYFLFLVMFAQEKVSLVLLSILTFLLCPIPTLLSGFLLACVVVCGLFYLIFIMVRKIYDYMSIRYMFTTKKNEKKNNAEDNTKEVKPTIATESEQVILQIEKPQMSDKENQDEQQNQNEKQNHKDEIQSGVKTTQTTDLEQIAVTIEPQMKRE